jgi:tRNA A37 threonylcarbamoyltransferase TsaD
LKLFCEWEKYELRFAEKSLCTDNAAMIGILAERKLKQGISIASLDEEIKPGWVLA